MAETAATKHEPVHLRLDEAATATPLHAWLVAIAVAIGVVSLLTLSGCGGGGGGTASVNESAALGSSALGPAAAGYAIGGYNNAVTSRTSGSVATPPGSLALTGQPPDRMHGLDPGETFTVQPGTTGKHGWIEYSCPAGGAACVLSVIADGTVVYERNGGVPFIAHPVPIPDHLPREHGLERRTEFTVQPGVTEKRGNVEITCPAGGAACTLSVTAGFLVQYDPAGGIPSAKYIPPEPVEEVHATFIPSGPDEHGNHPRFPPGIKYWLYEERGNADRAPVMEFDRTLHVGADVAPPDEALDDAGSRGGVTLSKGEVRDGSSVTDVLDYLKTMARGNIEGIDGLQKWNTPAAVQIVGTETNGRYIRLTHDAARIVNTALPFTQRLKLHVIWLPVTEGRAEYYYHYGIGNFFVRFVPKSNHWWSGAGEDELGRTRVLKYVAELGQRKQVGGGGRRTEGRRGDRPRCDRFVQRPGDHLPPRA